MNHHFRMGRQTVLVGSTLVSSTFKMLKSFAPNFYSFVLLEMIDSGIASAIYPAALILGIEQATSKKTILVSCIILASYPMGQIFTAFVASYVQNYKILLRIISVLGLLTFPYIWILPESLRWLLVNKHYSRSVEMVKKVARINKTTVSVQTYNIITSNCKGEQTNGHSITESKGSFLDIVKSGPLLIRLVICTFCWVSSAFITYGVSIMSTSFQGDKVILSVYTCIPRYVY